MELFAQWSYNHTWFVELVERLGEILWNTFWGLFWALVMFVIIVIIVKVLIIVASVGLGTIVGMVVKKAASEELGQNPSLFNQSGSGWALAATFLGLGIIPSTLYTGLTATDHGFQNNWYLRVMLLGLTGGIVFAITYQRRRIRRLGKEKAAGVWFFLGLVISAASVGAMGSVTCTSLAYLSWQDSTWLAITTITCGVLTCGLLILFKFTPSNVKLRPAKEKLFFYRDGNTIGPFTESDVDSMLAMGQLRQTDMFLREGVHDWVQVGQSELNARMPQQQ